MSYNTGEQRAPPPLAMPAAQLPPLHPKPNRRRYFVKTRVYGSEEMEKGYEPQQSRPESEYIPQATESLGPTEIVSPGYENDEQMHLGDEPHSESMPSQAREAIDDMMNVFLGEHGRCVSVRTRYNLLQGNTRAYIRSLGLERLAA